MTEHEANFPPYELVGQASTHEPCERCAKPARGVYSERSSGLDTVLCPSCAAYMNRPAEVRP